MPNHVLGNIKAFLEQQKAKPLELVFGTLVIKTYVKGGLLHKMVKKEGRLHIFRAEKPGFARMEVLDNLVFRFSLLFPYPDTKNFYENDALELPRPLAEGYLKMAGNTIQLEFTIDARNENERVQVRHFYTNLHLKNT